MKVLLITSYCGNEECTDDYPCEKCLQMCNVVEIKDKSIIKNYGGFGYNRETAHYEDYTLEPTMDKYMMATKATHKLGDISRDEPDLCYIYRETDTDYIGTWVTGYGFFDVKFPKETTRGLIQEEIEKYNKTSVQISNQPPIKLKVG